MAMPGGYRNMNKSPLIAVQVTLWMTVVACASSPVPSHAPPIYVPPDVVVDLLLDGVAFELARCEPGSTEGFHGAELTGKTGARIRLVSEVDGASKVVVFRPGAERGTVLDECSRIEMTESSFRHSSSVRGRASIQCEKREVRIMGTGVVENCRHS